MYVFTLSIPTFQFMILPTILEYKDYIFVFLFYSIRFFINFEIKKFITMQVLTTFTKRYMILFSYRKYACNALYRLNL